MLIPQIQFQNWVLEFSLALAKVLVFPWQSPVVELCFCSVWRTICCFFVMRNYFQGTRCSCRRTQVLLQENLRGWHWQSTDRQLIWSRFSLENRQCLDWAEEQCRLLSRGPVKEAASLRNRKHKCLQIFCVSRMKPKLVWEHRLRHQCCSNSHNLKVRRDFIL